MAPAIPKKKWLEKPAPTIKISEAEIQDQLNDLLEAYGIEYIRIPDGVWRWIMFNAPATIQAYFKKTFQGIPDNVCFLPIDDKYYLAIKLELKTATGQLHGRQKYFAKTQNWIISRSTDDNIRIINEFLDKAKTMRRKL